MGITDFSTNPLHTVSLSNGFFMCDHEVTQKEWLDVMGSYPNTSPSSTYGLGDNFPMYYISWYDAIDYCNALSAMQGLTPAYTVDRTTVTWNQDASGYRLPTEAEWEYACRAGTTTAYYTGSSISSTDANYGSNIGKATAVKSYPANPWGLYDMAGNVYEMCWDWYSSTYLGMSSAGTDPIGAASGTYRVLRGGSWYNDASYMRSAYHTPVNPSNSTSNYGFRVVLPLF
jgi:formylglycine-generating enzyme required for sulfatase activity